MNKTQARIELEGIASLLNENRVYFPGVKFNNCVDFVDYHTKQIMHKSLNGTWDKSIASLYIKNLESKLIIG